MPAHGALLQGIVKPSTVVACVATALAPVYNWVLIYRLGLGLDGAAWAMNAAQLTMLGRWGGCGGDGMWGRRCKCIMASPYDAGRGSGFS